MDSTTHELRAGALGPARELLRLGRFSEAREVLRRARRRLPSAGALPALMECEALAGLGCAREALAVATRALSRPVGDADLTARLRVARALALWQDGRVAAARHEAGRALAQSGQLLTRARALEALGLFAWKDQDLGGAVRLLEDSLARYRAAGSLAGPVRALGLRAAVARDLWQLEEALALQDQRLETASSLGRADLMAEARTDRASLLAALGRWEEARVEAEAAAEEFARLGDSRELTAAGPVRAVVAQARGDLASARAALARARERLRSEPRPRVLADALVVASDLELAAGDAAAAEATALEALRLFGLVGDPAGRCRSRVRLAHALVAQGRPLEAVQASRRAFREAGAERADLRALALVALGRGLLRARRAAATSVFERALETSRGRPGFADVARLGLALARQGTGHPDVADALAALEAWGDRRVLAYALADVRDRRAAEAGADQSPPERLAAEPRPSGVVPAALEPSCDPAAAALVDAAHALGAGGPWAERWAAAARALAPVLPWWRAARVGEPAWELRGDRERPAPLPAGDLARVLAVGVTRPMAVDLRAHPDLRLHPTRALHGLGAALLAPLADGSVLYFDVREECPLPSERHLGLVAHLARLLARHPCEAPAAEEAPHPTADLGMVGRCPAMEDLRRNVERAARFEVTVHLCGETGTGKEKVAEALHLRSTRAGRPFVAVNASSLSDELFESEMFGHVRGSFTGALTDREGHVAEAEGGTLFLDEVTDLSARGQAKLLRLLELKEYRRVGETRTRRADVRFLTASNVPLEQRVAEGRFRQDLVYRLNRVVLALPPLRERGDDVLLLARHFLRRAAARAGLPTLALAAQAERALLGYAWPGNVRELENEMSRLVMMAGPGPIGREHLSAGLAAPPGRGAASLREALQAFEREHIARALRLHGGNRARTASLLGLSRQALVAKISRLGIASAPLR